MSAFQLQDKARLSCSMDKYTILHQHCTSQSFRVVIFQEDLPITIPQHQNKPGMPPSAPGIDFHCNYPGIPAESAALSCDGDYLTASNSYSCHQYVCSKLTDGLAAKELYQIGRRIGIFRSIYNPHKLEVQSKISIRPSRSW